MRLACATCLVLSFLGCSDDNQGGGPGGGGTGPGNGQCGSNADCGSDSGLVCSNIGQCLPPSELMAGRVTWTVSGSAANATSCASIPALYLEFFAGGDDGVTFSPVPCQEGNFSFSSLPSEYQMVEIGINNGADLGDTSFTGTGSGSASFDITP
jgi:hypothetical protein